MNKAILIGNVGSKNDLVTTDGGVEVITFTIATSETFKDKNGEKTVKTEWHNCKAFKSLATIINQHVHKGNKLYVEGKITNQTWEDKDGVKKNKTEIIVSNIEFLQTKSDGNNSSDQQESRDKNYQEYKKGKASNNANVAPEPLDSNGVDSDLPF